MHLTLENFYQDMRQPHYTVKSCGAFLCPRDGTCKDVDTSTPTFTQSHYYDLIMATSDILLSVGSDEELNDVLFSEITKQTDWAKCFDRQHVSKLIYFGIYAKQVICRYGIKLDRHGLKLFYTL